MLFIKVDYHSIGFPTPPTDVHSPYAWAHSPAALAAAAAGSPFSPLPLSPFPTVTSLLSPTASHPSSVSSSREDLQATMEREILKRRYVLTSCIIYMYILTTLNLHNKVLVSIHDKLVICRILPECGLNTISILSIFPLEKHIFWRNLKKIILIQLSFNPWHRLGANSNK